MNDFDKLTRLSNRLQALIEDPQPGLFTWNNYLNEVLQEMCELLDKKGFRANRGFKEN
jgi:hypothetical protein